MEPIIAAALIALSGTVAAQIIITLRNSRRNGNPNGPLMQAFRQREEFIAQMLRELGKLTVEFNTFHEAMREALVEGRHDHQEMLKALTRLLERGSRSR